MAIRDTKYNNVSNVSLPVFQTLLTHPNPTSVVLNSSTASPILIHTDVLIESLWNPRENIFLAARHLRILTNQDFPGLKASQFSDNHIKITGARYNCGPDVSLKDIQKGIQSKDSNYTYGLNILKAKSLIFKALQ